MDHPLAKEADRFTSVCACVRVCEFKLLSIFEHHSIITAITTHSCSVLLSQTPDQISQQQRSGRSNPPCGGRLLPGRQQGKPPRHSNHRSQTVQPGWPGSGPRRRSCSARSAPSFWRQAKLFYDQVTVLGLSEINRIAGTQHQPSTNPS